MHQTQLLSWFTRVLERNETNQQTVHVIVFEMHKRAEQSQNLTQAYILFLHNNAKVKTDTMK